MLKNQPFKTFLVGGAVRDKLLGLEPKERDWVVVGATPKEMLKLGFKQVGKDFPVFLHPETGEEFALARTERKTAPGYKGFVFHSSADVSLEDDLLRRDLTINAMALDEDGNLIDPYHGKKDLENRVLRHVSNAFVEDPVRILRVARFAAKLADFNFTIATDTMKLMRQMIDSGEINALVANRVWQELDRTLALDYPEKFFEVLNDCNALEILFAEIYHLQNVPQPKEWHPEIDTFIHVMMVLKIAVILTNKKPVRFAALMHDVGKALTDKDAWPKHHNHEELGVGAIKKFCTRYPVPTEYKNLAIITSRFHGFVHKAFELNPTTIINLFEKTDAFRRPDRFFEFLIACEADCRGRLGFEDNPYPQREFLIEALDLASKIDVKAIIDAGFEGRQIAAKLHEKRVNAIKSFIKNYSRK